MQFEVLAAIAAAVLIGGALTIVASPIGRRKAGICCEDWQAVRQLP